MKRLVHFAARTQEEILSKRWNPCLENLVVTLEN